MSIFLKKKPVFEGVLTTSCAPSREKYNSLKTKEKENT
jgi:hypothetical protein